MRLKSNRIISTYIYIHSELKDTMNSSKYITDYIKSYITVINTLHLLLY
jgi:hypothetical protein